MANMNSIGDYIRQQREQAKISLRQLADQAGVSNPYLSQIERGLRKPSAEILQQIAKGLRISAEALYVQAGILEDRPGDSGVRAALLTDPQLTERQKQVLVEIYESFRRESRNQHSAEIVAVVRDTPEPEPEPEPRPVPDEDAWSASTAEQAGAEQAGAEQAGAEQAGTGQAGAEQAGTGQSGTEQAGNEPA